MSAPRLDAGWRAALLARTNQPPRAPRVPLTWDGRTIGSVEPAVPLALGGALLCREGGGYAVPGDLSTGLERLALALRAAGLAHAWRDEQLAVCDTHGVPLASVERAVVRVLGIATRAVHLVGFDARGRVWLQLRASSKANDPGKWDTLMGGMVGARDTLETALERETWEEAGLRLEQLLDLQAGGWLEQRRPAEDGTRHGYLVEATLWSRCVLPDGVQPRNQDGEVERFECVAPAEVVARLQQDLFTDEAALVLLQALGL
ncbi:NUDIX hydrolase [Pseudorhodoferax sp.]|uniref:NUDIX hydrolase n=1 Tax=Pseudorhodoferax sp. TaxID=1993553 RepID=UPI0039E455EE